VAISLKLSGALLVDASTNTALVANSGSDNLECSPTQYHL
jgi:hypothetical protein